MKAIVVTPGHKGSLRLVEQDVPTLGRGGVLLKVQKVGICGTDRDIVEGFYGEAPPGSEDLVLGHESLCRVADWGRGVVGFRKGDLVVPTVRRDCGELCLNCRRGESDMCLTGHYKEHGIKGLHGFAREFAVSDWGFIVKLPESLADSGVLLEPLSIVEKGLDQAYSIQTSRMAWKPKKALVLGAGPVGLLATAIIRLKGLKVQCLATRPADSPKARLAEMTGASYLNANETPISSLGAVYDIVFEVTGNTSVALQARNLASKNGIVSYMGIYRTQEATFDIGEYLTRTVLGNNVSFGSVNANKRYFAQGVRDMVAIRKKWPAFFDGIISHRLRPDAYQTAYGSRDPEEIKSVIEFGSSGE